MIITINLIVAINKNNAIGYKGKLLYRIKKDLSNFSSLTRGNFVVMGRNSYEEIGKPLPYRTCVVMSSNEKYKPHPEVIVINDFNKIINHYKETGYQDKDLFICGGESIYNMFLPYCDKVYVTYIYDDKEGDTHFNFEYVKDNFDLVNIESHSEDGIEFDFLEFHNNKNNKP